MTMATSLGTTSAEPFSVELPEAFTENWNRIDGITVEGNRITVDPKTYFFRYENPTWLLADWDLVVAELLSVRDTTDLTVEQRALDFVKVHGRRTNDPAEVLATGYQVAARLFREEYLADPGLDHVTAAQLKALREATTIMALNRVELDGHISNVGPCWFFPVVTGVVYQFTEAEGQALDELYHGAWFNEYRRIECVLAHAALGGRLVHGCQAQVDMKGGCVLPYGADLNRFRQELDGLSPDWMSRVEAMGNARA